MGKNNSNVKNLCKNTCKTRCISMVNLCGLLINSQKNVYKKVIPLRFSNKPTYFPTTKLSLSQSNFIHYSTAPTITTINN